MEYTTQQRKEWNQAIQDEFEKCVTYHEKLEYMIRMIRTSQEEYMKYTNNLFLTEDYGLQLLKEMDEMSEINDSQFVDFVEEKIITPMNAGHLLIKPTQTIKTASFIAAREKEEKVQKKNVEIHFLDDKSAVVVKIKSFSRNHLEEDRKVLKQLEQYLTSHDYENVIIDIRGNTGGTDEYFELFSMFTSKPVFKKEHYRNLITGENESVEWMAMNGTGKDYNRYLLVDDKVFSTSDSFARLCKNNGFATVIGEPTRGEGYGETPFILKISNSEYVEKKKDSFEKKIGMNLIFPIEAPINEKGKIDYDHFYRTIPDILCTSEEALQVALNQIEYHQSKLKNTK